MDEISIYYLETSIGRSEKWSSIPGVTKENENILNNIGYGTVKGINFCHYLNSLNNGYVYGVILISSNYYEYTDKYVVAVYKK